MARASYLLAEGSVNVYHEFVRLQSLTQWWHWLLLVLACAAVLAYVTLLYRRDSAELPAGLRWGLLLLRVTAFAGILFFYFDLEKRSEQKVVKNSRTVLLVDTSLSMGIQDGGAADSPGERRRIDDAIAELARGQFIRQLRQDHEVVVYRFDQTDIPVQVASFAKELPRDGEQAAAPDRQRAFAAALREARWLAASAGAVLIVAVFAVAGFGIRRLWRRGEDASWGLLVGMVGSLVAVVLLGVAQLRHPDIGLLATLGLRPAVALPPPVDSAPAAPAGSAPAAAAIDWAEQLAPRGSETRLGDALRYVVEKERGGPIAGVIVFTDGGSNAGVDTSEAASAAADASVAVFPVGFGSASRPANVAIVDMEAPARVYPGDRFGLTGYLQAHGLTDKTVEVELVTSAAETGVAAAEQVAESRRVRLGPDGEIQQLKFEVLPEQPGRRNYQLRVEPPREDHDSRDDSRSTTIEVVERKNRVLLIAGGPTREFQFLRNMLFRDRETTVDVLLQTARPGISQEAARLLVAFPATAAELFEYDAIVALDPDWLALSAGQVQLLERWVAEQAGGLIVVAASVQTPQWLSSQPGDGRLEVIKGLYPVAFYGRSSLALGTGRFAAETAWPLEFTRDGQTAEFLWLEDDSLLNEQAWASFRGVYGYFPVKGAKPGATVYARFSDPNTAIDGELPMYLAGQFYGAGRVFFQASGEMWRLRALNESYFDRYYTKLIRWASQGRLLRDSTRGVLLVDKERCLLGDSIAVRALLMDAQQLPLTAPEAAATLVHPDGRRTALLLRRSADATRDGVYLGQFTALVEGDYRIELPPPQAGEEELLTKSVRARLPALETERPQRNDALLRDIADKTRGEYYVGLTAAVGPAAAGRAPLARVLQPQDQVSYLPGSRDKWFEQILMTWLMALICGALALEWLVRRIVRLA